MSVKSKVEIVTFSSTIEKIKKNYNKKNRNNTINEFTDPLIYQSRINISQYQPKAELTFDRNISSLKINFQYEDAAYNFLHSTTINPDRISLALVLTPEYSMPFTVIRKFLDNHNDKMPIGTLYVLCCEGMSNENFMNEMKNLKNLSCRPYVHEDLMNYNNGLINALLYIVKLNCTMENGSPETKIIIISQQKTMPMHDPHLLFEGLNLVQGKKILYFDGADKHFLSLICADAFNHELLEKVKALTFQKNTLIFNPQLNENPRHGLFRFMRSYLVEETNTDSRYVKIITLNWADSTEVRSTIEGSKPLQMGKPWSAVFEKATSSKIDDYSDHLSMQTRHGIEYVLSDSLGIWLFYPYAHHSSYTIFMDSHRLAMHELTGLDKDYECGEQIPTFIKENPQFHNLLHCISERCPRCKRLSIDRLLSFILGNDEKILFSLHENGIYRITAKQYGEGRSKSNLYILKQTHKRLLSELTTYNADNFKYSDNKDYNVIMGKNDVNYDFPIRVYYMNDMKESDVKRLYDSKVKNSSDDGNFVIIYYTDDGQDDDWLNRKNRFAGVRRYPEEPLPVQLTGESDTIAHGVGGISMSNPGRMG